MHEYEIAAFQSLLQIESVGRIRFAAKIGKRANESFDCVRTVISQETLTAPAILRFEDAHVVTASDQLRGNTAQKMRVAMVPIGNERMVEESYI